jgi:membrane protease YdiL (CAAX protease family)
MGLIGALLGAGIAVAVFRPTADSDSVGVLLVSLVSQNAAMIAWIAWVAHRKAQTTLRGAFGFELRWRDWWWLPAGSAVQLGAVLFIAPLAHLAGNESQRAVDTIESARGLSRVALAIAVITIAPAAEELLFRGVLLRSLMRKISPGAAVATTAVIFAGVHWLLDPSLGSAAALPALTALALLAGDQAVRTGSLSRPILLHAGFNLVTAVTILLT